MPRWTAMTNEEYVQKWVEKLGNGCWKYLGKIDNGGYGRHGYFYKKLTGKNVPKGFHLDHLCKNRACVNPDHLEPVTPAENTRRGKNAKLTKECAAQIILHHQNGFKQKDIAAFYQMHQCNVSRIINQLRWS